MGVSRKALYWSGAPYAVQYRKKEYLGSYSSLIEAAVAYARRALLDTGAGGAKTGANVPGPSFPPKVIQKRKRMDKSLPASRASARMVERRQRGHQAGEEDPPARLRGDGGQAAVRASKSGAWDAAAVGP
eukprot:5367159-Pleurochrysis_carterae.AAC.1